jgi:hypothetical protein
VVDRSLEDGARQRVVTATRADDGSGFPPYFQKEPQ